MWLEGFHWKLVCKNRKQSTDWVEALHQILGGKKHQLSRQSDRISVCVAPERQPRINVPFPSNPEKPGKDLTNKKRASKCTVLNKQYLYFNKQILSDTISKENSDTISKEQFLLEAVLKLCELWLPARSSLIQLQHHTTYSSFVCKAVWSLIPQSVTLLLKLFQQNSMNKMCITVLELSSFSHKVMKPFFLKG